MAFYHDSPFDQEQSHRQNPTQPGNTDAAATNEHAVYRKPLSPPTPIWTKSEQTEQYNAWQPSEPANLRSGNDAFSMSAPLFNGEPDSMAQPDAFYPAQESLNGYVAPMDTDDWDDVHPAAMPFDEAMAENNVQTDAYDTASGNDDGYYGATNTDYWGNGVRASATDNNPITENRAQPVDYDSTMDSYAVSEETVADNPVFENRFQPYGSQNLATPDWEAAPSQQYPSSMQRAAKLDALVSHGVGYDLGISQQDNRSNNGINNTFSQTAYDTVSNGVLPSDSQESPQAPGKQDQTILSAKDFAVVFGKPSQTLDQQIYQTADSFARAWAEDGSVLKYNGANPAEADAPPSKDSRAASGWLPGEPELPLQQEEAPAFSTRRIRDHIGDNQLFVAYGASYAEAYAAALAMEFRENKPIPDDKIGDVSGLVSTIMHTPSGEPILLGTVMVEETKEDTGDTQDDAQSPNGVGGNAGAKLSVGRRIVRYLLLVLGAATFVAAGLYFTGYLG